MVHEINKNEKRINLFCDAFLTAVDLELSRKRGYGCVTYKSSGSHSDMDYTTFIKSSEAIVATLKTVQEQDLHDFKNLREFGIKAEENMFKATEGINTHKGMIFLLLFLYMAWLKEFDFKDWSKEIIDFSKDLVFDYTKPKNSALLHSEGINDIRQLPLSGYELIFELVDLIEKNTDTFDDDRTTLYLISKIDDTTTIKRSSISKLKKLQAISNEIYQNYDEKKASRLDEYYINNNISSGGVADLVTITNLLLILRREYAKTLDW